MALDNLQQDVVVAWRTLSKSPGYALIVVVTLALGIATNTMIFSLMNPYLIRELPYRDSERLVQLGLIDAVRGWDGARFSLPQFADWKERSRSFEDLATYYYTVKNVTGGDTPERIMTGVLSGNMFSVLDVSPLLGRTFTPDEGGPGGANVLVLGYPLWQRRFAGDPDIVGQTMQLDGAVYDVIGVMPPRFNFPFGGVKMWIPNRQDTAAEVRDRRSHILVGRLAGGVTVGQAKAELSAIQSELGAIYPDVDGQFAGVSVKPLREALNFAYQVMRIGFAILLIAVSFVLLIACVNVASLTLVRTGARCREVAVRAAIGAPRGRIVRQLLTESVMLAVAGGALGVALAHVGARTVAPLVPEDLFRVGEVSIDPTVLAFSVVLTLLTPVFFGLAPAMSVARADLAGALKDGSRGARGSFRARRTLVVFEVALAIVLIGCTGLMLRSFVELQQVDLGFHAERILTLEISLPESDYASPEEQQSYFERAASALEALPGVNAVGTVSPLPMNHESSSLLYADPNAAQSPSEQRPVALLTTVSPRYFQAMGVPRLAGREFTSADGPDSQRVVIVNETLAESYWPDGDPVGASLVIGDAADSFPVTVVGVVGDVQQLGFDQDVAAQIYRPLAQTTRRRRFLVMDVTASPESQAASAREALAAIDPNLPLTIRPMNDVVQENTLQWSLSSLLLGTFGGLALLLASLGIYGVVATTVSERRREIGIRMALGATGGQIRNVIVSDGVKLTLIGMLAGLTLALVAASLMRSALYGVSPFDPLTFGAVALVFLVTAVVASAFPAHRASRVEPVRVLRSE